MSYKKGNLRLRCGVPLSLLKNAKSVDKSAVLDYLNTRLGNTYSSKDGYLIKLTKMVELNENMLSDLRYDSIIIDAVYEYIQFNLQLNEVVLGVISDFPVRNNKPFIQAQVGPSFIQISVNLLPDTSYRYSTEKSQFTSITTKKSLSKGDEVRLKIVQKTQRIHRKTGKIIPAYVGSLKGLMLGRI